MGEKIVKIYELVTDKAGLEARMELAKRSGVPRSKAAQVEDKDELLEKFIRLASEIIGQDVNDLL